MSESTVVPNASTVETAAPPIASASRIVGCYTEVHPQDMAAFASIGVRFSRRCASPNCICVARYGVIGDDSNRLHCGRHRAAGMVEKEDAIVRAEVVRMSGAWVGRVGLRILKDGAQYDPFGTCSPLEGTDRCDKHPLGCLRAPLYADVYQARQLSQMTANAKRRDQAAKNRDLEKELKILRTYTVSLERRIEMLERNQGYRSVIDNHPPLIPMLPVAPPNPTAFRKRPRAENAPTSTQMGEASDDYIRYMLSSSRWEKIGLLRKDDDVDAALS
eukprot:jgi/Mesvir1/7781/Mv11724-RA.1